MELNNSFHTELAIGILLNDEKNFETKLAMLTEIGIVSENEETLRICEKFRDRLCSGSTETRGPDDLHSAHKVRDYGSSGQEVPDENNGDE
jgi:hypothetical protein